MVSSFASFFAASISAAFFFAAPRRLIEPCQGALERGFGKDLLGAFAAHAQRVAGRAIAVTHQMAQLRQHSIIEPFEQRRALAFGVHRGGIAGHGLAQFGPIADRGAHIVQSDPQFAQQFAPLAGIDLRGLDINQRFKPGLVALLAWLLVYYISSVPKVPPFSYLLRQHCSVTSRSNHRGPLISCPLSR